GVGDVVVPDLVVVAASANGGTAVVVEPIVLDKMTAAAEPDAAAEPAHVAAADRRIRPWGGKRHMYAVGLGGRAGREVADLEIVAVDRDVVGRDGDRVAAGDRCGKVLAQAPGACLRDHRGDGVDEADAGVVAFPRDGGRGNPCGDQEGTCEPAVQAGARQGFGVNSHAFTRWL